MPKFIKGILVLSALIGVAIMGLYLTDNEHIFRAVKSTYLIGRSGPDIDNHSYFENREVKTGKHRPWKKAENYNGYELIQEDQDILNKYRTVSYLVLRKGEMLFETYPEGESEDDYANSFSMAKSIISMLIGIAIDDGLIGNVDDKASKYLDELQGTDREKITIKQLLRMTSGIGFDESYGDPFGFMAKAYYGDELREKTFDYSLAREPDTQWEYLGGNTLLLSYILENVTGKTLSDYASEKLWIPLGAGDPALWTYDEVSGVERAYCCFYSNARDFARLGQLVLCQGNWDGVQLISPGWIEASMEPVMIPDATGKQVDYYGYQWWLMEYQGDEVYYMRGIDGQYVFAIPSKEMVIVRQGHERNEERRDGIPIDVF